MSADPSSGLRPLVDTDYYYDGNPNQHQVELGRLLFYDKILSGNRNISCATCHHPLHNTGDGLAVSVGEGGDGLGSDRSPGAGPASIKARIGRNAQPLFNLGAQEFTVLFHDGRVETDPRDPALLRTPIGDTLPEGVDNPLAAQALFPLLSVDEMAGQPGENDIADAISVGDEHGAWRLLEQRIRSIPEYVELLAAAYPHVSGASDISIVDVGNAIAAFTTAEWRADNSPFDEFLRGDTAALSDQEKRGYELFYGDAGCSACHSGTLQTDHRFHAIAMPQTGPGKGHGSDGHEDFGRELVTGNPVDRYRFRTPTLRNIAHTGPWGHSGAYDSLEAVVRHHLDPADAIRNYETAVTLAPSRPDLDGMDYLVQQDAQRREMIAARSELAAAPLSDDQVQQLIEFLGALSDASTLDSEAGVPERVPSGLPVPD